MKEISTPSLPSSIIELPKPNMQPVRFKGMKRWAVAQGRTEKTLQRWQNQSTEDNYHTVIHKVKEIISLSGGGLIYERNLKHDPEAYTGMHSFITSQFYWQLDCELNYNYEVYFAFHNCPYENTIRQMMTGYPFDRTAHEYSFAHGYEVFYKGVLAVQSPTHFTTLKATG